MRRSGALGSQPPHRATCIPGGEVYSPEAMNEPHPNPDAGRTSEDLVSTLYEELRRLAAGKLAREAGPQTLQATALVHEAWLRLGGDRQPAWANRAQFFAAAAEAMRRILIDKARRKQAARHGGGRERVTAAPDDLAAIPDDPSLLAIDEALERLSRTDPEKAALVKLHFFGGLTFEECGEALEISTPTAKRYWTYARAWLFREISREA